MDISTFRHICVQHNSTTEQTLIQDSEPGNMEEDSSWKSWRTILLQRRRKILVRIEDKLTSEKMEHLVQQRERNGQTSSPWQQLQIKIKLVPEEAHLYDPHKVRIPTQELVQKIHKADKWA